VCAGLSNTCVSVLHVCRPVSELVVCDVDLPLPVLDPGSLENGFRT
jgi:hypothetical protein